MAIKTKSRCHLCTEFAFLTEEHIPPKSAGNSSWAYAHTISGMQKGAEAKVPPPPLQGRNGIKRRSLCKKCNEFTAKYYNAAFKNWTEQAAVVIPRIVDRDFVYVRFTEIKPLAILKQIATMALATADGAHSIPLSKLRRFVLYPFEPWLPNDFGVRIYLNPPRKSEASDKLLTTRRLSGVHTMFNVVNGTALFCFAEIAHNPMGYLVHFANTGYRLPEQPAELTDISHFGNYKWGEKADIELRLPVRNPFGPVGGYYVKVSGPGTWTTGVEQRERLMKKARAHL